MLFALNTQVERALGASSLSDCFFHDPALQFAGTVNVTSFAVSVSNGCLMSA
jgi:hypothetical protein